MQIGSVLVDMAPDGAVVILVGAMHFPVAEELDATIRDLIEKGTGNIVVDIRDVASVDSSIVGVLIGWAVRLQNRGRIKVCSVPSHLKETLDILRADTFLPFYKDRTEAFGADSEEARSRLAPVERRAGPERRRGQVRFLCEERRGAERRRADR